MGKIVHLSERFVTDYFFGVKELLIDVMINDTKLGELLLDTGATYNIIDMSVALKLDLYKADKAKETSSTMLIRTANGLIQGHMMVFDKVTIGNHVFNDMKFLSAEVFPHDMKMGILGMDFLQKFKNVNVDFTTQQIVGELHHD